MPEDMRKYGDRTLDLTKQEFEKKKKNIPLTRWYEGISWGKTIIYWQKETKGKKKWL